MLLELTFPQINPVALKLGPISIHWYALMYILAFALGYVLMSRRLRKEPYASISNPQPWTRVDVEDMLLGAILGVLLGGRLGYILFYQPGEYLANPIKIFFLWEGGMSFHGGLIGVMAGLGWYAWRRKRPFFQVTDLLVPAAPIGLAAGRLGNFINGELWGRPAPEWLPWAMVFPTGGTTPRHPSQIYQLLLEGLLLFVALWLYANKPRYRGQVSGAFLFGYGVLRFAAEYFREPDAFLGLLGLGLSMGQWLCIPMIVGGAGLWLWARKRGITDVEIFAEGAEKSDEEPAAPETITDDTDATSSVESSDSAESSETGAQEEPA